MATAFSSAKSKTFITAICIILVALNLRPIMASIGPLLNQITETITISYIQVSLLTTLPILAMGICMFTGNSIRRVFGLQNTIFIALALIFLATLARYWYFDVTGLILTSIIAGFGIAIIQSLMPTFIKINFNNVSLLMGFYATAIMGGATISASLGPWIANLYDSWQLSLSIWAGLALIGLVAWCIASSLKKNPKTQSKDNINKAREQFIYRPRAWLLAIFFGLGTATYTCVLAWLSPWYLELGFNNQEAGGLLAYLTLLEVMAGLTIPGLAAKYTDKRPWLLLVILSVIIGFIGLALSGKNLLFVWPALLGIGIGGIFPMSLIISMDHINDAERSGNLTAFTQGVGYIIAAFSPILAGFIRSITGSFQNSWFFLVGVMIVMIPLALCFNPNKYAEKFR